jgi:hypothetical protein
MVVSTDFNRMIDSMSLTSSEVRKFLDNGMVTLHVDEDNVTPETTFNTCVTRFIGDLENYGISITLPLEDIFLNWRRIDRFFKFTTYLLPEGLGFKLTSDDTFYHQVLMILNGSYGEEGDVFTQYLNLLKEVEGGRYEGIVEDLLGNIYASPIFTIYLNNIFKYVTDTKSKEVSEEQLTLVREYIKELSSTMFFTLDTLDVQLNLGVSLEKIDKRITIYCQQLRNIDHIVKLAWLIDFQKRKAQKKNILYEEIMLETIYTRTILNSTKLNPEHWKYLDVKPDVADIFGMLAWRYASSKIARKDVILKECFMSMDLDVLPRDQYFKMEMMVKKFDGRVSQMDNKALT